MPAYAHRVPVDAPLERLSSLLLDKIERPDRYIREISGVHVERRIDEHTIVRRMRVGDVMQLTEVITADEKTHTVVFKAVGHPDFTSTVINTIYEEDGRLYLEYAMVNTAKPGRPGFRGDGAAMMRGAVEHMRALAEAGQARADRER